MRSCRRLDFSTLMEAENLVLSGVSSFAMLAAQMSTRLKKLYVPCFSAACTDLFGYMDVDKNVQVHRYLLKDYVGVWNRGAFSKAVFHQPESVVLPFYPPLSPANWMLSITAVMPQLTDAERKAMNATCMAVSALFLPALRVQHPTEGDWIKACAHHHPHFTYLGKDFLQPLPDCQQNAANCTILTSTARRLAAENPLFHHHTHAAGFKPARHTACSW